MLNSSKEWKRVEFLGKEMSNNEYNWSLDFDEYLKQSEPHKKEKAQNWNTAIGLQAVDGLRPSEYLIQTAKRHIEGDISIDEVRTLLHEYYEKQGSTVSSCEEADKVSANIAKLLNEKTFTFSPASYIFIHRYIFDGVFDFAGKLRDYNITKKEWVLEGETVLYSNYNELEATLEYDFTQEKKKQYKNLTPEELVKHIAQFTSALWQIHPFGEGNTRTTAVFIIQYLCSMGFDINNEAFAEHSWYFRNALVRANYKNYSKGIEPNKEFLERFFRNILLQEQNELKNRYLHVQALDKYRTSTGQVPDKYRTNRK